MTSGLVDKAASRLRHLARLPVFVPVSKAFPGFFIFSVAIFLTALANLFAMFPGNFSISSASTVISLTVFCQWSKNVREKNNTIFAKNDRPWF